MRRVIRFLVRNWPLRLAAVALATVLYAGLVLSQNARFWPGPVAIQPVNQPPGAFLLDPLPAVTQIRYLAPAEVAGRITNADFRAYVDLSAASARTGSTSVALPVVVEALNTRVQVTDWTPREVSVRLDPIETRVVPVTVDTGAIPEALDVGEARTDVSTVRVRGAASLVSRVREALARVVIDPNGINVDEDVDLIAVDARGEPVAPVDLEPAVVHVQIQVGHRAPTRPLPLVPTFLGAPADGYEVGSIELSPVAVTVQGDAEAISELRSLETEPIVIDGATSDVEAEVGVVLPEGVTRVEPAQITAHIGVVERRGTRTFEVGVRLVAVGTSLLYSPSVPSVLVTLEAAEVELDALDPGSLAATASVSGLGVGEHVVPLRVAPPAGASVVSITPPEVAVTISAPSASPTASPEASGPAASDLSGIAP